MELPCFDDLKKMAKDDPAGLEELRRTMVQSVIDSASPEQQEHLKKLQWVIDQKISIAPNPVKACVEITKMMRDSFEDLRSILNEAAGNGPTKVKTITEGNVLEFKK